MPDLRYKCEKQTVHCSVNELIERVRSFLKKMRNLISEIFSYFNPIFIHYAILYGLGKIYEVISNRHESIWQTLWNKYMNYFGDNDAVHIVLLFNLFPILLYWGLGAILFTLQKLNIPKSLANYKIQTKESEIEKGKNLLKVRYFLKKKLIKQKKS